MYVRTAEDGQRTRARRPNWIISQPPCLRPVPPWRPRHETPFVLLRSNRAAGGKPPRQGNHAFLARRSLYRHARMMRFNIYVFTKIFAHML